jgi:Na+-driven multidrug efflux pump
MSAQMMVLALSGVLMISLVNQFGVDTTAAYGAEMQLWNYIQTPAFAIGMAASAMAAQNVGARKLDRVNAIARVGVLYSVVLTGSVVLVIQILDQHAFGLFLPAGSEALRIALHLNKIVAGSFIFFGVTVLLFSVVRATGAVILPLLVSSLSLFGVRFPLAYWLLERYHAEAIWWSFPASSVLATALALLYYKYGGWRSAHMLGPLKVARAE